MYKVEHLEGKNVKIILKNDFKFHSSEEDGIYFRDELGNELSITGYHYPSCCEQNYLAGGDIDSSHMLYEHVNNEFVIEFVDEYGIRINTHGVPCYSEQNGYYSDDIDITISYNIQTLFITDMKCELIY